MTVGVGRSRRRTVIAAAALGVGLLLAEPARAGEERPGWLERLGLRGHIEVGGLPQGVDSGSAKFEEYRDIPGTAVLPEAEVRGREETRGYYFEFLTEDAAQEDQRYRLRVGRAGEFEIEAGWDQIPHRLSNSSRTLYRRSGDDLVLDDATRDAITSDPGLLPAILELARRRGLGLRDDNGWLRVRVTPFPFLTLDGDYRAERRRGTRAVGTASAFTAGASVLELPAPFEYVTHNVTAGAEYARRGSMLRADYRGSIFRNPNTALSWDNPLSTDDAPNSFATGRLAREPDNQAHEFRLQGRTALPASTTMTGSAAYGFRYQDDDFLPLTSNRALFDPPLPALPARDLNGWVNTILVNYRITSRPLKGLRLSGRYRFYDFDDSSRRAVFTDHVIADSLLAGSGRRDLRFSYSKQTAGAAVGWRPIDELLAEVDYEWVRWHRENRETRNTDDNTVKASVDTTPIDWLLVHAAYTHAVRDPGSYEAEVVERSFSDGPSVEGATFALLRKYDVAHRDRDAVTVSAHATPRPGLALSATFELGADDYDRSRYGLLDDDRVSYSFDASYDFWDRAEIFAGYTREEYRYNQRSRFRPVGSEDGSPSVIEDAANDWHVRGHDSIDTVGAGGSLSLVPDRLEADLSYNFSFGFGRLRASGVPGGDARGEVEDYPNVKNRLHQLSLIFRYRIRDGLRARFGYAFERFSERDFATDPVAPFMGGVDRGASRSVFLGAKAPGYTAHIGSVSLEYEF